MKLRPFQEDIVNQVVQSNDDTLIEVPTGGGKTLIARQISLELQTRLSPTMVDGLVIVSRNELEEKGR